MLSEESVTLSHPAMIEKIKIAVFFPLRVCLP